jgi:hypothetical protein
MSGIIRDRKYTRERPAFLSTCGVRWRACVSFSWLILHSESKLILIAWCESEWSESENRHAARDAAWRFVLPDSEGQSGLLKCEFARIDIRNWGTALAVFGPDFNSTISKLRCRML